MKTMAFLILLMTLPLASYAESSTTQAFDINSLRGTFLEFNINQTIDALSQNEIPLSKWGSATSELTKLRNDCKKCAINRANNEQCVVYLAACKSIVVTSVILSHEDGSKAVIITLADPAGRFQYTLKAVVNCHLTPFRPYCSSIESTK